jgi:hypothetical protein
MIAMYAMQAMAHSHTAEVVGLITASAAMKSTASAEAKTVAVDAAAASHKAAATSVEATASHKAATSVETAASHKAATSVETAASHKSAAVAAPASASLSRRHGADRCERQGARSEQALESMFDRHMHDSFSIHSLIVPPLLAGRFRSVLQTSSDMIDSRRLDVLHHGQKRLRDLHWRASHFTVDEEHQPARFALDLREDRSIAIR